MLKEAAQRNELSHVYLEMYYSTLSDESLLEYHKNWRNADYMKISTNKIVYMFSSGGIGKLPDALFPFVRYRANLDDWDYVKERLHEKQQPDYLSFTWEEKHADGRCDIAREQGFRESIGVFADYPNPLRQKVDMTQFSMEESKAYCRWIIEYCQKREIPITLFVSPISDLLLISTLDYDRYVNEIRQLAAEYGVPFYDFNLVREEYLSLQDTKYFYDADHLNRDGAALFTTFFNQVMFDETADEEKSSYFYTTYKEKLQMQTPALYGVYSTEQANGDRTFWLASNRDGEMEYRIVIKSAGGETYLWRDFNRDKRLELPADDEGVFVIDARMEDCPDEIVRTMEYIF